MYGHGRSLAVTVEQSSQVANGALPESFMFRVNRQKCFMILSSFYIDWIWYKPIFILRVYHSFLANFRHNLFLLASSVSRLTDLRASP